MSDQKKVRLCSVEGCGGKHEARGFCKNHYARHRYHGQIQVTPKVKESCSESECTYPLFDTPYCYLHFVEHCSERLSAGGGSSCQVDVCTKEVKWAGFCVSHYRRKRKCPSEGGRTCSVEGCNKPYDSKGCCSTHYRRLYQTGSTERVRLVSTDRDEQGRKQCSTCREWRSESMFSSSTPRSGGTLDGLLSQCNPCRTKFPPEKFGISEEAYEVLLDSQGGCCYICQSDSPGERYSTFAVDHDHSCCPTQDTCGTCVRGLLCWKCNTALGQLQDSIPALQRAIEYLNRPATMAYKMKWKEGPYPPKDPRKIPSFE